MNQNTGKNLTATEKKVIQFVEDKQLLAKGDRILAGVSGGADSVCLLFMLLSLREYYDGELHIEVVHVHHMLRGKEADEDMSYVETLCREHQVTLHAVKKPVEEIAASQGWTLEEAGRRVRYEVFETIGRERKLDKIAVAHHRDDNAETVLMNLFRGSGLKGVAGIPFQRENIIRPLLGISRDEIEAFLEEKGITYRTDSTNLNCDYTRNKIRNELLPYIEEHINKKAREHLVQFAACAEEIDCYFQKKANILFEKYGKIEENRVILCLECLTEDKTEVTYLIRKALNYFSWGLKDISCNHVEQIVQLMYGRTGAKCNLPGKLVVGKSYQTCIFCRETTHQDRNGLEEREARSLDIGALKENQPHVVTFAGHKFTFLVKNAKKNETFPKKKYTKWFDCDRIESMLQLRTRQNGDYIVINHAGGRKKLKDYFIDEKVAREDRDRIPLLAQEQEILWITGGRISERYKVKEDTMRILEVCME